ncbi:MAG: hypothetical protein QOF72_2105 [Blastocatellia bacterium]|jgi:hypothetical protein|nr:hypothetical protein [Blastocatellia bacterium]
MPFTPANDLPPNPDVRIFFSGVMIIRPDASAATCEIYVNNRAAKHHLTIEVRQKTAGKPDLIKMRHVGPLLYSLPPLGFPDDPPIHGMFIQIDNAPKGVRSYNGTSPSTEGEDLGLAINLQSPQFQNGAIGDVEMLGGRPSILMDDAVFYTADKTDPRYTINLRQPNGTLVTALAPFASLIGANIYLDNNAKVVMQWRSQGLGVLERLELEKPQTGTSYEIYVINDPLYESERSPVPEHDEFNEYYTILPNVPNRFQLEVIPPGAGPKPTRGSTKTPCMSCIVDP